MNADILNKVIGAGDFQEVNLNITTKVLVSASDTVCEFRKFGGSGWLMTAQRQAPLHGADFSGCAAEWPEDGELCDGTKSLRLQRQPGGWTITVVEVMAGRDYMTRAVDQYGCGKAGKMKYEVFYKVTVRGSHEEYRPYMSRFAGFLKSEVANV